MKKFLLTLFALTCYSSFAAAGEVKVNWGKLDDFTEINPGHETKEHFRERLTKEFEDVFAALAKKLPDGYQLTVNVSDIDLAGDIRPGASFSVSQIRIMREIYWPRMNFSYELKNSQQEVIAQAKEELRDMDYLHRVRIPSGRTSFEYEEKMLNDWFKKQVMTGVFPNNDVKAVTANK
ncbi:DUF3016 domain-containing protein [Undibacterium flavidum]|uniref:DUF3016 domain-containing protein n=1 Tax=Undibacterium flavidum TaxID=2762297 RepID=A0ABR6YGI5_9BURK|nr:DUF3016 domain-containing protein [Undibacterium flavidum]MBC3875648.1 DUF3016 domain-containing protein [Undibacterium flavidum]